MSEIGGYRRRYAAACRAELRAGSSRALAEAAFPAYSNPNPLAQHLFWERIRRVVRYLRSLPPLGAALDFGCGGGVLLPFLAESATRVVAADTDLGPCRQIARRMPLAANVELLDLEQRGLSALAPESIDLIVALDVLEHVPDLPGTLDLLLGLLQPGGELVVSGPTENAAYRFGRWISGPEYTGDYHVRGILDIQNELAKRCSIRSIGTLFPLVPLFRIFSATRGSA